MESKSKYGIWKDLRREYINFTNKKLSGAKTFLILYLKIPCKKYI